MKKLRVAINGFGRIGRITFRQLVKRSDMEVVAINDLGEIENLAHLLRYDSVHRRFDRNVRVEDHCFVIDDHRIKILNIPDIGNLPWGEMDVDVVIESTGLFTHRKDAIRHVEEAGAKKVIISAPAKTEEDEDVPFIVLGVNDHLINRDDVIISNSSCTTNCVAPMIKILDDNWGIEKAFMTTVHSYTKDQNILDAPHTDWRRGRTAAYSIVPTTTGAAKAAGKIFPHLAQNLGGAGIRVPVPDGSLTDLTCTLAKPTSIEEINAKFKEAAEGAMKGILEYTEHPIVSVDVLGNTHSALFDAGLTAVLGDKNKLVKIVTWYDNEMGYSSRLVDLIEKWML